ncbi:MAG: response regulator transcription factor [Peptostreptococcaceae bacterium]|nr:response regulator transcription factor [Peptostreptococcaceae bacterium]
MKKINILISDSHKLIAKSIKYVLETQDDIDVISLCTDINDTYMDTKRLEPDIIILDVEKNFNENIQFIKEIKKTYREIKILILTNFLDVKCIAKVLSCGVDGYLLKDVVCNNLIESIRLLNNSKNIIDFNITKLLAREILDYDILIKESVEFSSREIQIIHLMLNNYSNKDIADLLNLKLGTIKNYISSIYSKLAVRNREDAIKELEKMKI